MCICATSNKQCCLLVLAFNTVCLLFYLSHILQAISFLSQLFFFVAFGGEWNGPVATTTLVNVTLGSYILLECNPPMANPAPKVEWSRNGMLIDTTTTNKYKVLPSGDLIIGNVVMDDITGGTYRCRVVNMLIFDTIDSPQSYQLRQVGMQVVGVLVDLMCLLFVDRYIQNLTIYDTIQPNTMLQAGTNAEIVCLAIGNDIDRLDYFFRRVGAEERLGPNTIPPSTTDDTNIDRRHTLFINGVTTDNAGTFGCSVRNFSTTTTSAIKLQEVQFNISVFGEFVTSRNQQTTLCCAMCYWPVFIYDQA